MNLQELSLQTKAIVTDILDRSAIKKGQIFVLGLSSSEVIGGVIGKNSSREIGQVIVKTILEACTQRGVYLAVQGCEHLNRALVLERDVAEQKDLEIVNVLPSLHAGGSGQLAAFDYMTDPVEVEEVEEEEAPRSQVEQVVENIDKIVEEIESDNKEDLIHTVTLDPAKIRRIIAEDEKKKKQDAAVDSVIDSLK